MRILGVVQEIMQGGRIEERPKPLPQEEKFPALCRVPNVKTVSLDRDSEHEPVKHGHGRELHPVSFAVKLHPISSATAMPRPSKLRARAGWAAVNHDFQID